MRVKCCHTGFFFCSAGSVLVLLVPLNNAKSNSIIFLSSISGLFNFFKASSALRTAVWWGSTVATIKWGSTSASLNIPSVIKSKIAFCNVISKINYYVKINKIRAKKKEKKRQVPFDSTKARLHNDHTSNPSLEPKKPYYDQVVL